MKNYFLWGILLLTGSYNLYGGEDRRMLREEGEGDSVLKIWDDDRIPEKIKNYNTKDLLKEEKWHESVIDACNKNKSTIKDMSILGALGGMLTSLFGVKYNDHREESWEWLKNNKKITVIGATAVGSLIGATASGGYFIHQRGNIKGIIKTHMKEIQRLENRMNKILEDESLSDEIKEAKLEEAQESLQELIQELNEIRK